MWRIFGAHDLRTEQNVQAFCRNTQSTIQLEFDKVEGSLNIDLLFLSNCLYQNSLHSNYNKLEQFFVIVISQSFIFCNLLSKRGTRITVLCNVAHC